MSQFRGKRLFAGRLFAGRLWGATTAAPAPQGGARAYARRAAPKPQRRDTDDDVLMFLLR